MLASFHGGGIDIGIEEAESCSGGSGDGFDGSAQIITDLISQGAGIHAQTDRTGEWFSSWFVAYMYVNYIEMSVQNYHDMMVIDR